MYDQVVSRQDVLGGKPCINGTRISVEFIMELVASGASSDDIVRTFPYLSVEAIEDALRYGQMNGLTREPNPSSLRAEDDLADTYVAQIESAMRAGWDNPQMDAYNDWESHSNPGRSLNLD